MTTTRFGGRKGITTTSFKTTGNDAFTDPPKCMMQRQGNFITGFWPEDVQADIPASVDVMPFPAYEGGYDGTPVLGGGDLAAAFHGEDKDVQEVMTFLTSDKFGKEWAAAGGWLSPHKTFDLENYSDPTTKAVAEVAVNADVFRFDGSDLMPGEVGAGIVLAGHDRLVRRRVDRQGPGRHRSVLAAVLAPIRLVCVALWLRRTPTAIIMTTVQCGPTESGQHDHT